MQDYLKCRDHMSVNPQHEPLSQLASHHASRTAPASVEDFDPLGRLFEVASDRKGWSELLGLTKQSWRRQRDATSAQGS